MAAALRPLSRRLGALAALALVLAAPAAALAKRTLVYVHDRKAGGGIYAFSMSKFGVLAALPGSPFPLVDDGPDEEFACLGSCQTMAYSPKRKTLYTGGPAGVSAWTVAVDGTLVSVPGSPFAPDSGGDFLGTGVVEAGKRVFVYAAAYADGNVYGWEAAADGSLVELGGSPFASGLDPDGLATRKKFVFVANEGDEFTPSSISSYVAATDGTLVPAATSPLVPPNVPFFYNVFPDARGKFLYVDGGVTGIHVFAIDKTTAALAPIAGSPFATLTFGAGVLVTKRIAYAVGLEIAQFALQPFTVAKSGALARTSIDIIPAPQPIDAFAADKAGKRLAFAGPNGVATANIDDKREGSLTRLDLVDFTAASATNAVVVAVR